jgi:hypothetical protein
MKHALGITISASLIVATFLLSAVRLPHSYAASGRAVVSIGAGAIGQHTFEFIGKIDQNGSDFTSYGYITYMRTLPASALFTDAAHPSESTARFTYYAPGKLIARSVLGTLFDLASTGTMTIYASAAGGAAFANPVSFRHGTVVAVLTTRQQSIVNVQAPNQGILTLMGEASQQTVQSFTLLGGTYRMGHVGLQAQLTAVGQGTRMEPTAPRASFNVAGAAIVGGEGNG